MAPKSKQPAAKPTNHHPPVDTDARDNDALDRVQATPPRDTRASTGLTTRPAFKQGQAVVWMRNGMPDKKFEAKITSIIGGKITIRLADNKQHIVPEKDLFHPDPAPEPEPEPEPNPAPTLTVNVAVAQQAGALATVDSRARVDLSPRTAAEEEDNDAWGEGGSEDLAWPFHDATLGPPAPPALPATEAPPAPPAAAPAHVTKVYKADQEVLINQNGKRAVATVHLDVGSERVHIKIPKYFGDKAYKIPRTDIVGPYEEPPDLPPLPLEEIGGERRLAPR